MKKIICLFIVLLLSAPVVAKQDKGKGPGGSRADNVSEMGMEKGKAWAGTKEKKIKDDTEEEVKKEKKEKKEKKSKK